MYHRHDMTLIANGRPPILLPPSASQTADELDLLAHDTLALAAKWAAVNITGLSLDEARAVIRAEIDRLTKIAEMEL